MSLVFFDNTFYRVPSRLPGGKARVYRLGQVYSPTHVGMNRLALFRRVCLCSIPHTRGMNCSLKATAFKRLTIPQMCGDETVDIMTFIMKCITTEKNGTVKPYKVIPDGATLYKGSDFEGPKVIDLVIRDFMKSQLGLSDARIDNFRR
jgi:hypothetical protein